MNCYQLICCAIILFLDSPLREEVFGKSPDYLAKLVKAKDRVTVNIENLPEIV